MRIGITFDLVPADRDGPGPDDRYEEFDKPETIAALADVIRGEGHDVVLLGDGRALLERSLTEPPDFVFNLAEGEGVGRCREARVPAALELLGIPYSGSDPLTLAAALDKGVAKRLLLPEVPVPRGWTFPPDADPAAVRAALGEFFAVAPGTESLIVKPAFEGSSKGIRSDCLADGILPALNLFARLARDYAQPVVIEEFIAGDEVTVGLVGNGAEVEVLGLMRIAPKGSGERFVYSLDVKRDWRRRVSYESPARLDAPVRERFERVARLTYAALGCRDLARIDFRLRDGVPYFIEANPLPGLSPVTSDLMILARGYGIGYEDLIRRVLNTALERVGLRARDRVESRVRSSGQSGGLSPLLTMPEPGSSGETPSLGDTSLPSVGHTSPKGRPRGRPPAPEGSR